MTSNDAFKDVDARIKSGHDGWDYGDSLLYSCAIVLTVLADPYDYISHAPSLLAE